MRNAHGRRPASARRSLRSGVALHVDFVHLHYAARNAQQQPGMPGSMGFTGGIVASNVPPQFEDVTFEQRLGEQLPLDAEVQGRERPRRRARRLLRLAAGGARVRVLPVPDAVPAGDERHFVGAESGAVHSRARTSTSSSSASIRAIHPKRPTRRSAPTWITGPCRRRRTAGISSPATRRPSSGSRGRGFTYQWDEETQQFAHVSGVLVTTPTARCPAISTAWSSHRRTCGWRSSIPARGVWDPSSRNCCSTASTTTRLEGRYGAAFMNILRLGGVLTVGLIVGFIVLMRWRESRHVAERHA